MKWEAAGGQGGSRISWNHNVRDDRSLLCGPQPSWRSAGCSARRGDTRGLRAGTEGARGGVQVQRASRVSYTSAAGAAEREAPAAAASPAGGLQGGTPGKGGPARPGAASQSHPLLQEA